MRRGVNDGDGAGQGREHIERVPEQSGLDPHHVAGTDKQRHGGGDELLLGLALMADLDGTVHRLLGEAVYALKMT
jgi:hypothetical protein